MSSTLNAPPELKIRETDCFIDGKWVPAVSGKTFATVNPATEEVIAQVAEGDKEVHRWIGHGTHQGDFMGVAPTGKSVTFTAIYMSHIVDGEIVEEWGLLDTFAIMQQIGAIPAAG